MIRLLVRRSIDASYLTSDPARELDGLRDGDAGWWLRGTGDAADAREVEGVFSASSRSTVVGYDVVVAAPRPVSILVALDPEHAGAVVAAHRASVAAAIDYLEQRALVVRDRRGGEDLDIAAQWKSMVGFTHGVNRHGEPHLHDHVLVGAGPEGASHGLDSRALFAHVPAADALYRSSLRHEVARRTAWVAWRSFNAVELVAGLDEGYRALWGGHHDERGEKRHWERRDATRSWAQDRTRYEAQGVVPAPQPRTTLDEHAFAGALEGRYDVARRHLVEAWANATVFGQSPADLQRSLDELFPQLAGARGVRELTVGVGEARMVGIVRERGPRPLRHDEFAQWTQRSRDRSWSRADLSR